MRARSREFKTRDLRLVRASVRMTGDRGIVLLCHGGGSDGNHPMLLAISEELEAKGFSTARIHFSSHHPGRAVSELTIPTMIRDLNDVEKQIVEEHPNLPLIRIGHSLGGMVILASAESPSLQGDVLIDCSHGQFMADVYPGNPNGDYQNSYTEPIPEREGWWLQRGDRVWPSTELPTSVLASRIRDTQTDASRRFRPMLIVAAGSNPALIDYEPLIYRAKPRNSLDRYEVVPGADHISTVLPVRKWPEWLQLGWRILTALISLHWNVTRSAALRAPRHSTFSQKTLLRVLKQSLPVARSAHPAFELDNQ